jgi:hypothetical protein
MGETRDIELLVLATVLGVAPWLLDKLGVTMPRSAYLSMLVIAVLLAAWAIVRLRWIEKVWFLRGRTIATSNASVWLMAIVCVVVLTVRKPPFQPYVDIPLSSLEQVIDKRFSDETIDVDGKNFERCTFTNVTLRIHGAKTTSFRFNRFFGTVTLATDDPASAGFGESIAASGMIRDDGTTTSWSDEQGFYVKRILPGAIGPLNH